MKIVHNQLPLGERRFKQASIKDEVLSKCPCCRNAVETMDRFLQCDSNSQRASNLGTLEKAICTSDAHPARYLLSSGILHWLEYGAERPFKPSLNEFPPHFAPFLQDTLAAQSAIAWGSAVRGFFSKRWHHIASLDMHYNRLDLSTGDTRLRSTIHATHEFTYVTWIDCNNNLQGTDDATLADIRSAETTEIRHYHSLPHLLLARDRHYCSRSLDKLLSAGSAATRRRWLNRVKNSVAAQQSDSARQSRIDSFFSRSST